MFDYFYYYQLPLFLNPIFSLVLIICLGIITPYIIILANKDKDYKNKKLFIIYEKAINILSFLHLALTLIFIIISILAYIYGLIFLSLIIGAIGIAIIYGLCYILEKNNISIAKPNIKWIIRIILYIIIPICIISLLIASFSELVSGYLNSISIVTVLVLLSISFLLFYFLAISKLDKNFISINSKLDKDDKNTKNSKRNSSSEVETTKEDNNDNDYMI